MKKALLVTVWIAVTLPCCISSKAMAGGVGTSPEQAKDTVDSINSKSELPDLIVESLYFHPDVDSFTVVVRNVGNAPAAPDLRWEVKGIVSRSDQEGQPGVRTSTQEPFSFSVSALAVGEAVSLTGSAETSLVSRPTAAGTSDGGGGTTQGEPQDDIPIDRPMDLPKGDRRPKGSNRSMISSGIVSISVHVDSGNRVEESDETNNALRQNFKVVSPN